MPDTAFPVTPGAGRDVKVFQEVSTGDDVQYVRQHTATVMTLDSWPVSATAATSRVAADETRVALVFTNTSAGSCYLRPDATAPTTLVYLIEVPAGGTYEVPVQMVELAWSVVSVANNTGNLHIWKGTVN